MTTNDVVYHPSETVPGISDAVEARSAGLVFLSGQIAPPDAARSMTFTEELDECFAGVARAASRAGIGLDRIATVTIYVTDLGTRDLAAIRNVRDRWFSEHARPASSLIGVAALADPALRAEVSAVGVLA